MPTSPPSNGVDFLFAPSAAEMYPRGFATTVSVGGIAEVLEGAQRGRGHFDGVATVVTKLFTIVAPDIAYFGQKDAQQTLVIKRLVRDLNLPLEIEVCPTVREPDGLATVEPEPALSRPTSGPSHRAQPARSRPPRRSWLPVRPMCATILAAAHAELEDPLIGPSTSR